MSDDQAPSYEPMGMGASWAIVGGVVAMIVFTAIAMAGIYAFYLPEAREGPIERSTFQPPRLQSDPQGDLSHLMRNQRHKLETTAWRDDKSYLVIPIDAAMAAIAARGSEAFAPLADAQQGNEPAAGPDGAARPRGAVAPADRRANPGAGEPSMMEAPR